MISQMYSMSHARTHEIWGVGNVTKMPVDTCIRTKKIIKCSVLEWFLPSSCLFSRKRLLY